MKPPKGEGWDAKYAAWSSFPGEIDFTTMVAFVWVVMFFFGGDAIVIDKDD